MKKNNNIDMLEIIHNNHKQAQTKERIEKQLKDYRTKKAQENERKQEQSEQRALTMMIISLILIYMFIIGLI